VGRGTRKGEKHPDKDHFTVFDCFDGTLLQYFKKSTGITKEEPLHPTRPLEEIVGDIWANKDRDYNIGCLVKRLQRIDKAMSGEAREMFARYVPGGDLAGYARGLPGALRRDFAGTMQQLKDKGFQELLVRYKRAERTFVRAYEQQDNVSSVMVLREVAGVEYKPESYLTAFARFVKENPDHIDALQILLDRPQAWNPMALTELREKLGQSQLRFTVENLQWAHERQYKKALVDVISMVKHAAKAEEPLLTAPERVDRAFAKVTTGKTFSGEEQKWLGRIRQHLQENLSIDRQDFEVVPILDDVGGWGTAKKAFGEPRLLALLGELNEAIAG
jgi:type I restriction enzyme, R subunit